MRLGTSSSCSGRLCSYLKNEVPTILRVAPIVAALKKYGQFTGGEVQAALLWGSGPSVLLGHPGKGRLWDSDVDPKGNAITISFALEQNYGDFHFKWASRKTAADRDQLVQVMKSTIEWIPHRTYTYDTPDYALTFFENQFGKRIWALGAVLLESLVRLGVRRKFSDTVAAGQSTLFQKAIYGKAVVDDARRYLAEIYLHIQKLDLKTTEWHKGAKKSF